MRAELRAPAAAGALCLGATLLYAGTLGHPPIWDDHTFVFGQPFMMECSSLRRALDPRIFSGVLGERNSSRPVWQASVLLDTCAGGGEVSTYRTTSILLHALCALLLFALALSLTGALPAAAAAGALFAVHPAHAEVVNIITFRADLLCLLFMLASVLAYRHRRPWTAVACAVLALLSKEMAVVLPLLLALGGLYEARGASAAPAAAPWRRGAALLAAGLLTAAYLVFQIPRSGYGLKGSMDVLAAAKASEMPFSQPLREPRRPMFGLETRREPPPWDGLYTRGEEYARIMTGILGSYLRTIFWPARLQGDYAPLLPPSWAHSMVAGSIAAWGLLLLGAWFARSSAPLFSFGMAWAAVALLPVSGLTPLLNLQADRYVFIASAGGCLAAAALLHAAWGRGGAGRAAAGVLFVALAAAGAARTFRRNGDFVSDRAFHQATLAVDPRVARAHLSLAAACVNEGDVDCARRAYEEGLRMWPANLSARSAYIDLLLAQGDGAGAEAQLVRSLEVSPNDPLVLMRLAHSDWRRGLLDVAEARLRQCMRAAPAFWPAQESLGILLFSRDRASEAAGLLEAAQAASLGSADSVLYHLALVSRRLGRSRDERRYLALLETRSPRLAALARGPSPKILTPRI